MTVHGFQTSGKKIRIYINIYSPEHSIMTAYKHLIFQFVLLELATHLLVCSSPFHSRAHMETSLLVAIAAAFVKSKKKRNVISIHVLLYYNCCIQ